MELLRVEQIALDEATNALLQDIDDTARRVNEFRPLPQETVDAVLRDLLGERVYTSNAIEGNTLDLRETREVLKTGHVNIAKKREATEARNLGKVIEYSQQHLIDSSAPLLEDEFLKVHRMLLEEINDDRAGRFRDQRVMIHGAKHQPPEDRYVHEMVNRFFERLNEPSDVHPVLLGTWAHWTIARIHPFFDGNGRLARLWQDIVLFRNRLTCAIIRPEDREDYLSALEAADEGRFDPLIQLVGQRLLSTLDKYLVAQRRTDELKVWASDLVGEIDARSAEQRQLDYMRWSRKMEHIRFEFERCAARVTQAASNIEIQMRPYETIDQTQWESMRSGDSVKENWFFTLGFGRGSQYLRYIFFFGKHFWSYDLDSEEERKEPRVCLLISERGPGPEQARRLGVRDFDTRLSIRELFLVNDQLVRKRYDAEQDAAVYDRSIEPMIVAQEFIQDVLLVRMVEP